MYKTILIFIFLSVRTVSFSQDFSIGGSLNILTKNKNLSYQVGPSLILKYAFDNIPFAIQSNVNLYLSEISEDNKYFNSFSYNNFNFGIAVHYFLLRWDIEPYIGIGGNYNSNDIEQSGMPNFINGKMVTLKTVENNISAELISGLNFAAKSSINFIIELDYTINKPKYELQLRSSDGNNEMIKSKLDFNSVFIKLGLLFKL